MAGHDLGLKRPDLEDQVLPGLVREETAQALESVKCLGRDYPKEDLEDHFERVMLATARPHVRGKEVVEFTRLLVKAWRTGFLAAEDGELNDSPEIKGKLAPAWLSGSRALTTIAWVRSCSRSVGRSVAENMEHPLLKVAREYYEKKPTEQFALGGFFADHLATHPCSERECDFSAGALLDWVRAGLEFGKRFLRERPDMVRRAFDDLGPEESARLVKMIQGTVKQARGVDAARLLGPIIAYTHDYLRAAHPTRQSRGTELVIFAADYAVWVPWAMGAAKLAAR